MVIVIMGVSGAGKTTVGRLLAAELGWAFFDADDFHPPENVSKMGRGIPLTDEDRWPWLDAIRAKIECLYADDKNGVITCSALKEAYRNHLQKGDDFVKFIYLKGDFETIWERMKLRKGHYMKADMLASQFTTLEEPENIFAVDISHSPEEIVAIIRQSFSL